MIFGVTHLNYQASDNARIGTFLFQSASAVDIDVPRRTVCYYFFLLYTKNMMIKFAFKSCCGTIKKLTPKGTFDDFVIDWPMWKPTRELFEKLCICAQTSP